ncbi:hypothetical protein Scep_005099 [Stephania cephalantha]|uniref:Uncharacterized protein n=1 Tax=Stephania cephalantha TaxID=152367 RepID=A0AAP0KUK8_9MAGN
MIFWLVCNQISIQLYPGDEPLEAFIHRIGGNFCISEGILKELTQTASEKDQIDDKVQSKDYDVIKFAKSTENAYGPWMIATRKGRRPSKQVVEDDQCKAVTGNQISKVSGWAKESQVELSARAKGKCKIYEFNSSGQMKKSNDFNAKMKPPQNIKSIFKPISSDMEVVEIGKKRCCVGDPTEVCVDHESSLSTSNYDAIVVESQPDEDVSPTPDLQMEGEHKN